MKSKDDLFSEKMPSALKAKILSQAESHLAENRKWHRRSVLNWIFGTGLAAIAASVSFVYVKQNTLNSEHQAELAQSIDIFEDLQSDDDFDMIADFELIENIDVIEQIDEV